MPERESLGTAAKRLARAFSAAGCDTPEIDARWLTAAAAGVSVADLIAEPRRPISDAAAAQLEEFYRRRLKREPVSRILGEREFYDRPFRLSSATLDPRPDTETVVGAVLEILDNEGRRSAPVRIADIGTGSGILLVTLLAELPSATGAGTDISAGALSIAKYNAGRHGAADRAVFHQRRSLEDFVETFDILVCNPPYIPSATIGDLETEVRDFDPHSALDGGADGLAIYREIAGRLITVVPSGWAVFETGAGQSEAVAEILERALPVGCRGVTKSWNDLSGHTRVVAVSTHAASD